MSNSLSSIISETGSFCGVFCGLCWLHPHDATWKCSSVPRIFYQVIRFDFFSFSFSKLDGAILSGLIVSLFCDVDSRWWQLPGSVNLLGFSKWQCPFVKRLYRMHSLLLLCEFVSHGLLLGGCREGTMIPVLARVRVREEEGKELIPHSATASPYTSSS